MMAVAEEEVAEGGGSSLGTGTKYTLPSGPSVRVVTVRSRFRLFRPLRFLFGLAAILHSEGVLFVSKIVIFCLFFHLLVVEKNVVKALIKMFSLGRNAPRKGREKRIGWARTRKTFQNHQIHLSRVGNAGDDGAGERRTDVGEGNKPCHASLLL